MAYRAKKGISSLNNLSEFGFEIEFNSVPLFGDNTGALHVIGNSTYRARTKHIALRLLFLKELVRDGKITLYHIPTQNQVADIATKCLPRTTIKYLIGLVKESAA